MRDETLRAVGTWLLFATAAGADLFLVAVTVLTPWRRSPIGRQVFTSALVMAGVFTYYIVQALSDVSPTARLVARMCVYFGFGPVIWWQLWLLIRAQWVNVRERDTEEINDGAR